MILEQMENKYKYATNFKDVGYQIAVSGHLLIFTPRSNLGTAFRPAFDDRSDVRMFSASSACRMRRYLRECVPEYSTFITLTYPAGHGYEGGKAKRDLKVFMQRLRRYVGFTGHDGVSDFSAFWFMEFQRRGSIHFHIFTNKYVNKDWLSDTWYQIVGSEDKRHLLAGTNVQAFKSGRHGISAYAAKYAAKQVQKIIPDKFGWTGRFWGVCGDRRTVVADTFIPAECLAGLAVLRRIRSLENMVETCIKVGSMRDISKPGCESKIFFIKSQYQIALFRLAIYHLTNTISVYFVKPHNFELNIDISNGDYHAEMLQQA